LPEKLPGDDLHSHPVTQAVPSAKNGLTTLARDRKDGVAFLKNDS